MAETLITSTDFLPRIEACRASVPALRNVILVGDSVPKGYHSYRRDSGRKPGRDRNSRRSTTRIWLPSSTPPEPLGGQRELCTPTAACASPARC